MFEKIFRYFIKDVLYFLEIFRGREKEETIHVVYDKMALKASKLFPINEKEIQNCSRITGTWSDSGFSPNLPNELDR